MIAHDRAVSAGGAQPRLVTATPGAARSDLSIHHRDGSQSRQKPYPGPMFTRLWLVCSSRVFAAALLDASACPTRLPRAVPLSPASAGHPAFAWRTSPPSAHPPQSNPGDQGFAFGGIAPRFHRGTVPPPSLLLNKLKA